MGWNRGLLVIAAVTGGSGFIGLILVKRLLERGDKVRVLTRSPNGLSEVEDENLICFQGDLTNCSQETLAEFLDGVDVIFHCAGELNDETKMIGLHIGGTEKLLAALTGSTTRWVQLSSVGAYGAVRSGIVSEIHPENPRGMYEVTKTEADNRVRNHAEKSGMTTSILRPSIVIGSDKPKGFMQQMVFMVEKRLFFYIGSDQAIMNVVPVELVVDALLKCGDRKEPGVEIFNISDCSRVSDVVDAIRDGLGSTSKPITIPLFIAKTLSLISHIWSRWPLTERRIGALTGRATYSSQKIFDQLGLKVQLTSIQSFRQLAQRQGSSK